MVATLVAHSMAWGRTRLRRTWLLAFVVVFSLLPAVRAQAGRRAGTASALLGSLRFGLGTVGGVAISLWHDGTDRPLLGVISACLVGSLLVYRWIARPAARDTA